MTETWISECLDMTDVERQWTEESLTALIDILRTSCSISLRQPDLMSRKHPLSIAFENILQLCTYALTRGTQGSPPSSPSTETKDASLTPSPAMDARAALSIGSASIPLIFEITGTAKYLYCRDGQFVWEPVVDSPMASAETPSKPSSETADCT